MTKTFAVVIAAAAAAFLAGCSNGPKDAGPVPTGGASHSSVTAGGEGTVSTGGSTSSGEETAGATLCNDEDMAVRIVGQEGAAGTIRTVWGVRNTSPEPCVSKGYPGMDFHAASGWLDTQVERGTGFPDIEQAPSQITIGNGKSLHFISYWNDVDTAAGPCVQFDRVKVTLPDNFTSAEHAAIGCLNPESVRVGPITDTPPKS
jgi:Protein of unknown function (DUF4232)